MRILHLLLLIIPFSVHCQHLFEPVEIVDAIENNTRTRTGIPGPNYWQNTSTYIINATFSPETGVISGQVNLKYTNNSPDTLRQLYFKLMQNVYAKGSARAWEVDKEGVHKGASISNIYIDSVPVNEENTHIRSTWLRIDPKIALGPKISTTIQMNFKVPMQKSSQFRTGALDSMTIFAGYWFPQICVYDDIFGWDKEQYMLNTENYNDFSDYDVSLTLPGDYVVWATGQLQNPNDLFQHKILKRIHKSQKSKVSVSIIKQADYDERTVLKAADSLTWIFTAKQVPDFAWGASTHLLWDGVKAVNPDKKNPYWIQVAFPNRKGINEGIIDIAQKSVEHFSTVYPAIRYPYPTHTSFLGQKRGGMEFPMIANNSESDSTFTPIMTCHEIAHNYFPFSMGINERKFGWMDEMFTTQMELSFLKTEMPETYKRNLRKFNYYSRKYSGTYSDLPLMTESSSVIKEITMVYNFYVKPTAMFNALKSIIGETNLNRYIKDFMSIWEGKHPTPYDFFYFINQESLVNLKWFWDKWAFQFGSVDLALSPSDTTLSTFEIKNVGGMPVPFKISAEYTDGSLGEEVYNAAIWENKFRFYYTLPSNKKIRKLSVYIEQNISDRNDQDNTFELDVSKQN